MKPVLVVLCGGQSECRESMLSRIAQRCRVVLVFPTLVTWEKSHIVDHVLVDPDTQGYVAAAIRFSQEYLVAGVFTYHEWCIELAATIGEKLGVPHSSPHAATHCRDKWASREALREGGAPSGSAVSVRIADEARQVAHRIGYPVVVKPRAHNATIGVSRVSGPGDLVLAFDRVQSSGANGAWDHHHGVMIENTWTATRSAWTARYRADVSKPRSRREGIGICAVLRGTRACCGPHRSASWTSPRRTRRARGIEHRQHRDPHGIAPDLQVSADRRANGRSGGDLISELGWLLTGVDTAVGTVDMAACGTPDLSVAWAWLPGSDSSTPVPSRIVESCEIEPEIVSESVRQCETRDGGGSRTRRAPDGITALTEKASG